MANIRDCIRNMAKPDCETIPLVCTVDKVDKDARTIDCTPINEGAPLLSVNLQANQGSDFGICVFPEVGAFVVVGFLADGTAPLMLCTDKIESAEVVIGDSSAIIDADGIRLKTENMSADFNRSDIIFNGGSLNGLVIIQDLTDRLNNLVSEVNAFVSAYNGHTHAGAHGPTSPPDASASDASDFSKDDYENTKIKH